MNLKKGTHKIPIKNGATFTFWTFIICPEQNSRLFL